MLEIEAKARIPDPIEIERKVKDLGFKHQKSETQRDIYYRHPNRDFSKTDEALRIREIEEKCYLTYKGPKLDKKTKTRMEIEVEIRDAEKIKEILRNLGFQEAGVVKKRRKIYSLGEYRIFIDKVQSLGTFLEVEKTGEYDIGKLLELFDKLGIPRENLERRSYLELLLGL
jgi:adenylate cyclase class 2